MIPRLNGRRGAGSPASRFSLSRCSRRVRAAARRGLAAVSRVQWTASTTSAVGARRRTAGQHLSDGVRQFREPQSDPRSKGRHRDPRLSRPHRLPDDRVFAPRRRLRLNLYLPPPADTRPPRGRYCHAGARFVETVAHRHRRLRRPATKPVVELTAQVTFFAETDEGTSSRSRAASDCTDQHGGVCLGTVPTVNVFFTSNAAKPSTSGAFKVSGPAARSATVDFQQPARRLPTPTTTIGTP